MAEEMKRIIIVAHSLELGGAERSLIGLLNAFDSSKYKLDLFLLRNEGELLPLLPSFVNLLPEIPEYTVLARPMPEVLREGHVLLTAARLFGKLKARAYDRRHPAQDSAVALEYSHKYTLPFMPEIQPDVEYDLAISFLCPHYFAANRVRAKKRLAWIHTDYSKIGLDVQSETAMWSEYDKLISVSEAVTNEFSTVFPSLKNKIVEIENILPEQLILKQAREGAADFGMSGEGAFRLLSIGRFCAAKNFDSVPEICKMLLDMGLNIKWYLIGYGGDEALIRAKIAQFGMERDVIILGKKENPYPYIAACDLYVQPSRYEGKAVTVREAQMLGKPVVITKYPSSASQLEDGVDGVIVAMDKSGCAQGIEELLRDPDRMRQICELCKSRDYSNMQEVRKVYELIDKL